MQPLVSILIPAFNAQRWICETLASAIAQTWQNKEIIVVDDGSWDRTPKLVEQFASSGVRLIQQANQGAAVARNTAFAASHGDFIQWLDADDLLAPDKITLQMTAWMESPNPRVLLSGAWARFAYCVDRATERKSALSESLTPKEWLRRKLALNLFEPPCIWLVSRELTEGAGPWNPAMLHDDDGEYFCRVLLASEGTRFIPKAKAFYRMSGSGSLSFMGRSERKAAAQWLSLQAHIRYLRSLEDSPLTRAACLAALQDWLPWFYPERMRTVEEMKQLASELGGTLRDTSLPRKYAWIQSLFGWSAAKRARVLAPQIKWAALRFLDHVWFSLGRAV